MVAMPARDRAQLCVLLTGAAFVASLIRPPHPWEQQLQHFATPAALIGLFALARRGGCRPRRRAPRAASCCCTASGRGGSIRTSRAGSG